MRTRVFFLCLLLIPFLASAETLEEFRSRKSELENQSAAQREAAGQAGEVLDRLSGEIRDLRTQPARDRGVLWGYRLRSLLSQAQQLSEDLARMKEKEDQIRAASRENLFRLADALDRAVEAQGALAQDAARPLRQRKAAAQAVADLSLERAWLAMEQSAGRLPSSVAGLATVPRDPEEIAVRLDALADVENRLLEQETALSRELSQAQRQRFMRIEVAQLLEEEAFFDERGFVRGGAARMKKDDIEAAARLSAPPESPVPAAGVPPAPAEPPVEAAPADSAEPAAVQAASETRAEAPPTDRDQLARLATEFGLEPEKAKDLSSSGDILSDRISRLEQRLRTTKAILSRLGDVVRRLKERLPR